jgi:beta-galactosidase
MSFPAQFTWGAATSAYQIEGAWDADGKGPSVWDMFVRHRGKIWSGHDGRVSCDHFNHVEEDVGLMRQIGLRAYRFSISWPRVIPEGVGRVNPKGIGFYDRLVDRLLEAGVEPWVTLYHWDFPYALFLRGGWLNPDSPKWFSEYTRAVVDRLSDRVTNWATLNEPQCFIGLGYASGEHAPGLRLDLPEVLLAGHHALLAHGRATQVIRERAKRPPRVGWTSAGTVYPPATDGIEDVKAARRATHAVYPDGVWNNRWWSDPVVFGRYPEEGLRVYGAAVPKTPASDFDVIRQPLDFYGCNIFHGEAVRAGPDGDPVKAPVAPGHPESLYHWRHTPEALYWGPKFLAELYGLPIVITENGVSCSDMVAHDGRVHDSNRIDFMIGYLLQLRRAIREGVDVRGYFAWSLLDNFEWQEGYKHRYGLVHVDFTTRQRTLKESAHWYREVVLTNGGVLDRYVPAADATPQPYVVKETLRYIEEHVSEPFNVKHLAARLRCHPDSLSRRFKQHMGVELAAYIRQARIDHAREILRRPGALIDDAAERSGFSDRIHFTKVFRRITGMTPGQFQRQFRAAPESLATVRLKTENPRSARS